MKNKITISILFIFVLINTFLICKIEKDKSLIKSLRIDNMTSTDDLILSNYFYENTHLSSDKFNVSDSIYLCFFASELHCQTCVDSTLFQFEKWCEEFEINYKIVVNYSKLRYLGLFIRTNKLDERSLICNAQKTGILKCTTPICFIYNPNTQRAEHVFIPDKSNLDQFKKYLHLIANKLF